MKQIYFLILTLLSSNLIAQSYNWNLSVPPHARHINAIQILSNGKIIAVGGNPTNDSIQFIGSTTNGINNWEITQDAPNHPMVQDLFFVNNDLGFICGNAGSILKTTDNGENWSTLSIPSSVKNRQLLGIHFYDENNGIVVGGNLKNDSISTILKTNDGGTNWSVIQDNLGNQLNSVYFISNNLGFAVGNNGLFLKSTDGGLSWSSQNIPGNAGTRNFNKIFFATENLGFIVGGHPSLDSVQTILKSTDAGDTWTVIKDELNPMLNDIHFYDNSHGVCVGNNGIVLYSSDGGDSWTNQNLPNVDEQWTFQSVYCYDEKNAAIGGNSGAVFLSYDSATFYTSVQNLLEQNKIRLMPNPVINDFFLINENNIKINQIEVLNVLGQKIKTFRNIKQKYSLGELTKGSYYLKLTSENNKLYLYKFIKL